MNFSGLEPVGRGDQEGRLVTPEPDGRRATGQGHCVSRSKGRITASQKCIKLFFIHVCFLSQSECLKIVLTNLRPDQSLLRNPQLALERDVLQSDPGGVAGGGKKQTLVTSSSASSMSVTDIASKLSALQNLVESQKTTIGKYAQVISETDKQNKTLKEELDKERLERDSLLADLDKDPKTRKVGNDMNSKSIASLEVFIVRFSFLKSIQMHVHYFTE